MSKKHDLYDRCPIWPQLSQSFSVSSGIRQGIYCMSAVRFNIVLEVTVRKLSVNPNGTFNNRPIQVTAYSNDVAIISRYNEFTVSNTQN